MFSICTLVTSKAEYDQMLQSFSDAGFDQENSEFLYVDNSSTNRYDGYQAVNRFLNAASGRYVVICHQDVRLHDDRMEDLLGVIRDVELRDPEWGVVGNAGATAPGKLAIRISDPKGTNTHIGELPAKTQALDENFLVIRRDANLAVSRDIGGFHLYGTDLCIVADILGYGCYVVDFHLLHIGGASRESSKKGKNTFLCDFLRVKQRFVGKYRRAWSPRWVQNTGTLMFLSGSRLLSLLLNTNVARSVARRLLSGSRND